MYTSNIGLTNLTKPMEEGASLKICRARLAQVADLAKSPLAPATFSEKLGGVLDQKLRNFHPPPFRVRIVEKSGGMKWWFDSWLFGPDEK